MELWLERLSAMRNIHMIHRILPPVVIPTLLIFAGISLGCGASPTGPTPALPAASSTLNVGAVSPSVGPDDGAAEIRVSGSGFLSDATLTLGGVAARVTLG